jgi:uncharacterized protein (TIRG00374 family)
MKISSVIKYIVSLLLAAGLIYLVFKNVSISEFIERSTLVNYWWVGLSILIAVISHLLRAYRWNLLLSPFKYKLKTNRTFLAVMSGYLANLVFPRLGEITRCGVLKKNDGVSMSTAFGTVVIERLIDMVVLLSLVLLDVIVEFDKIYEYFLKSVGWEKYQENKWTLLMAIFILLALGLIGIWILKKLISTDFSSPVLKKISLKLKSLFDGFMAIKNLESAFGFVISSIGIWVSYYLMSYVIFFAIPETSELSFGAGLSILAAAGVSMAMPVQGGIGAYHALVSGILVIYGIDATTALFFATLLHTSQVLFVIVFGGVSILISTFISKKNQTALGSDS